ncbi:MAG: ferrochelatase [Cyclobacteriaceae bacterium]|nr:ferrochelatase [Cyclobacteriaceae bacterium]
MNKTRTGVLLVNLGTPDSPEVPDVRKYLREFLMDARVIDIPFLSRWLLVNLIIAPFRAPKSARIYRKLWTENGSPLLYFGQLNEQRLQELLGDEFVVKLGMRYQSPGIAYALNELSRHPLRSLIILPLFPQYASATTGSVHQKVMEIISQWTNIPEIKFINTYFDHPLFIKAFVERAKKRLHSRSFDFMLFSYHGLPERQIYKSSTGNYCQLNDCCRTYHEKNMNCYRAQCFETSRILAKALNIPVDKYKVVFQSRLGKDPWIQPYAEEVIRSLPASGYKRVAVMVPSFVADCLETNIEVGEEFREIFLHEGGEEWIFIDSLNDSETWLECLYSLVKET